MMIKKSWIFLLFVFLTTVFVYFLTSPGETPYNYFTRLAEAFLRGRYWLTENPPWLSELIPAGDNRYYVVYPPMPTLLLLPLFYAFGSYFPQQYLAHLLGAGLVVLTMMVAWKVKRDKLLMVWAGLLVGFGSIVWFLSSVGSAWYLGQITAAFFLTAALLEGLGQKRSLPIGFFLGAAYLSRIHTILSMPLFLYLCHIKEPRHKRYWLFSFFSGFLPFLLFNASYNFLRFGVPWDIGYTLIPGVLTEPWFAKGIIHPSYIFNNLRVTFLAMPKILPSLPYLQPSWAGLAIWITTPAFIYALRAGLRETATKLSWLTVIVIFLFALMHGSSGFAQFGYRFAVDFYPFLIYLTILGVAKTGLRWHHWGLLIIGIIVNLWGVLWINKFGWVSF